MYRQCAVDGRIVATKLSCCKPFPIRAGEKYPRHNCKLVDCEHVHKFMKIYVKVKIKNSAVCVDWEDYKNLSWVLPNSDRFIYPFLKIRLDSFSCMHFL